MKTATSLSTLTTVANFPEHFMLENLAVRADGSVLVVASPQRQVWYVPPANDGRLVEPILLHTFEDGHLAQCFVEAQHRHLLRRHLWPRHPAALRPARMDARWTGESDENLRLRAARRSQWRMPDFAPGVMLFSDCVEGLIWRVDLSEDGLQRERRSVWLKHDTMAAGAGKPPVKFSATMEVPFPGINGLRYGPKTNFVYYTTSSQDIFLRVAVDPATHEAIGEPEHIADVGSVDDLCLDEYAGVAYIARHPDHIIERVPLDRGSSDLARTSIAGQPFNDKLIGPTSIEWGRVPGDYGHVAYITTDGGTVKLAPDEVLRPARLMRIEFASENGPRP
jgi:hypothetical protein